jgi:tetratricopeptide (TPR) repeat protein
MSLYKGFIICVITAFYSTNCCAQPGWSVDLLGKEKKPVEYENKQLRSEKTDKKFTKFRRFFQNNVTHFNYYYNCNNRINAVLEKAKASYTDDYTQLLAYYPYTLEGTAGQKTDLDSTISSATAGILVHDIRSDWVDNMYLLIGKSYFLRKDFDSAITTFNFINYNLFPRKKGEDDNKTIGTRDNQVQNQGLSIADKEKRNFLQKATAIPPSRNDALVWLARALLENGDEGEAAGMLNTLQNDVNLPKRLQDDVAELIGYMYYRQNSYDSAAVYLEKALSNAADSEEKARWQFLLAQLYEGVNNFEKAKEYYGKASKKTLSPLLEIFAQLNAAKMYAGNNTKDLAASIEQLKKMAKRDKFDAYRDVIYYAAADLSMLQPDTLSATILYQKAIKYNQSNAKYKNLSFLKLADINYAQRNYKIAAALYDSLDLTDTTLAKQMATIDTRKKALNLVVQYINNIEKQDSLQAIALLPQTEREAFAKKQLRLLRKQQGLTEEEKTTNNTNSRNGGGNADLFGTPAKGDWYFTNTKLKSNGFNEFKAKWGKRANLDNWRRIAALNSTLNTRKNNNSAANYASTGAENNAPETILTIEALLNALPTTPEKLDSSNTIIASSLIKLAKVYQTNLQDYALAIETYNNYLTRFGTTKPDGEVYLGLYFCYNKLGNSQQAAYYKALLNSPAFANTNAAKIANNPDAANPDKQKQKITKEYETIYNLFIEGKFEEAVAKKQIADANNGTSFWTPQLTYIEALYNVRKKHDSSAIVGLQYLVSTYPDHPLKIKAETLIDVLARRKEIESYLTDLKVTRMANDTLLKVANVQTTVTPTRQKQDTTTLKPIVPNTIIKTVPKPTDTLVVAPAKPTVKPKTFALEPTEKHAVIMLLDKVDNIFVKEAKGTLENFNTYNYYGGGLKTIQDTLKKDLAIITVNSFATADAAMEYFKKIKKDSKTEFSWLPAAKYSFYIISLNNLEILKDNKNLEAYKKLLNSFYNNIF